MTMYLCVAFGLFIIAMSTDLVFTCPNNCSCSLRASTGTYVYCISKGMTILPTNFPSDSYSIDMDNNSLTTIVEGAFMNLSFLNNIDLRSCNITTIERSAFVNLPRLRQINFENNQISTIPQGSFKSVSAQQVIYLKNNNVQTVRSDTFSGITVYTMDLQHCNIQILEAGAFSEVSTIQYLYLQDNKIKEIRLGVFGFSQHPFLIELRLSRNHLTYINRTSFDSMQNLQKLYLDGNEIVYVETNAFKNMKEIRLLDLSNNNIAVIERSFFCCNSFGYSPGGKVDVKLYLNGNNLTVVNVNMFEVGYKYYNSYFSLWLNNNQITTVQLGAFQDLEVLTLIDLSKNQITALHRRTFHGLTELKHINLSNNQITELHEETFQGLTELSYLDLLNNQITTLPQGIFHGLSALYQLDLRENNLTYIRNDTFENNTDLRYLYLEIVCDCNIPFWSWLQSTSIVRNSITCFDRNKVQVSRLQASDFDNCTYNFCSPDYCSNNGLCNQNDNGYLECSCVGAWTGSTCTESVNMCAEHRDEFDTTWSVTSVSTLASLACTGEYTGNVSRYCSIDGKWEEPNYSNCIESANPCAENVDKFHTNWSKTAEDTLATLTCTGEYTGNVSRYCSSVGKWDVPNYSNCISKSIQYIKEQTAKLLSGAGNNVTIILIGLENITRNNNDLRSGDLLTSSSILTDIAKYVTDHKDKLSVDQLEIFASLCNNLLDERNRQPWEELIDGGSGGVTPLVNAVTEFNDAFNDVIESNFSLVAVKENVVMEVGRASSGEIIVPDRSKTNGTWISDSRTEIKLKLEKNKCSGLTGYSSTFYRNVSRLFPEYLLLNGKVKSFNGSYGVNSIIADFTIHGSSCSNYTLIIKFDHLLGDYIRPFCGHWDFNASNTSNGAWSSFGSQLVDAEDSYTICEYNHTTNFAILMSPVGRPLSRAHHLPLSLISTIGCGLSILFLVMTIIIHVVFWRDVSDDGTKVLMNLCVALIISYVLFLAGITQTENQVVCSVIAVAIHYLFLTDFALMLAEGILFVKMVVFIFNKRSIVNQLILPCWIVPAVIVGISAGVTKLEGYGNHKYCWLSPETNLIWAFIGPALLVITINVIVIIITVYKMMTVKAVATKTPKEKSKIGLKGIRVMIPLFGVTWVLGTFSLNDDLVMFQYLFAICNSLQIRKGYREYKRRRANQMDSKLSTECTNNDNLKTGHRRQNVYTEERDNTL